MATTKYYYRSQDNLTIIAKRYNTTIKTLTALNSWLINPHTKKTEMFPARIKYTYTMSADIAQRILTEKQIVPGTIRIEAFSGADLTGAKYILTDNGNGSICNLNSTIAVMKVNYKSREIRPLNLLDISRQFKSMRISYDADLTKPYLIVPLVGNGSTSIEDYWDNVDKITGISFNSLMENLSNSGDRYLYGSSTLYSPTDNRVLTESTLHLIENSSDFSKLYNESGTGSDDSTDISGAYDSSGTGEFGGLYDFDADFDTARIGGIVQTAINEGSKNMRDYFLYDIDHTSGKTLYQRAADPYKSELGATSLLGTGKDTLYYNNLPPFTYDENNVKRTPATYVAKEYGTNSKVYYAYNFDDAKYGSYDTSKIPDANAIITDQHNRWSRDKRVPYSYETFGVQRDNSLLQAVEVIIGTNIIYMPCWPENVQDGVNAEYEKPAPLGSSAPYVIYSRTSERSIQFTFKLHREMLDTPVPSLTEDLAKNPEKAPTRADEIDKIVRLIESAVYPDYDNTVAAVRTQVKIGNTLKISGVMTDQSTNWYGPIGADRKYKQCDISFTVLEAESTSRSYSSVKDKGRK